MAELDRRHADPAGRRVDQHPLARLHVAEVAQHEDRRQVVHRDRRALLERQAVGQREHLRGRHRHGLRVAAEPREGDDALPGRDPATSGACSTTPATS